MINCLAIAVSQNDYVRNSDLLNAAKLKGCKIQLVTGIDFRKAIFEFLFHKFNGFSWSDEYVKILENEIMKFCLTCLRKWTKVYRSYKLFLEKNSEWLNLPF